MSATSGKKSKYAQKMRRKRGSGRVDPRWMWWFERGVSTGRTVAEVTEAHRVETLA